MSHRVPASGAMECVPIGINQHDFNKSYNHHNNCGRLPYADSHSHIIVTGHLRDINKKPAFLVTTACVEITILQCHLSSTNIDIDIDLGTVGVKIIAPLPNNWSREQT